MVQLTDEQKVLLRVEPKTEAGNAAPIDGVPSWTATDPTLVTLQPAPDGLTCEVITNGPTGSCDVTCTADADLGEGVTEITGSITIEVVAAGAVTLDIANDPPVLKD